MLAGKVRAGTDTRVIVPARRKSEFETNAGAQVELDIVVPPVSAAQVKISDLRDIVVVDLHTRGPAIDQLRRTDVAGLYRGGPWTLGVGGRQSNVGLGHTAKGTVGRRAGIVICRLGTVGIVHTELRLGFLVVVVAEEVPSEVAAHEVKGVVRNEVQARGGQESVVEGIGIDEL